MSDDFVNKLREYFDSKGLTQKAIAEKLNVDPAYVNKLLTGKKAFGKKTAHQFQDLFGLSESWLLTGNGGMLVTGQNVTGSGNIVTQNNGDGNTTTNTVTMNKNERFAKAINYLRMQGIIAKNEDVAIRMGADPSNVSRSIKGVGNNPTDSFLRRFNKAFSDEFNTSWLLAEDGEMLNDGQIVVGDNNTATQNSGSHNTTTNNTTNNYRGCGGADKEAARDISDMGDRITALEAVKPQISYSSGRPYYNVDFIGGFDLVFNNQTTKPEYNIDCKPYNRDGVVWCNITGHSMEPKISHGDIIALREVVDWQSYLTMGEIYAIVTNNDLRTVKVIRKGSDKDVFRLVPINTAEFDEQEIAKSMIMRVFEVLGCIKRF